MHIRSLIPKTMRAALLRNRVTHRLLTTFVARDQRKRHPRCQCTFNFDGHRALGWATGGLASWEAAYFTACDRLIRHIQPRVVWDIGANVGIYTLYFASKHACVSHVVAYEPDVDNLAWLHKNIHCNHLGERVTLRKAAVSHESGAATFHVDSFTGSTGSLERDTVFITRYYGRPVYEATVTTTTIDDEIRQGVLPPDFLKIDVEGHEIDVFRGARRLLREARPVMLVEFAGPRSGEAIAFLTGMGYVLLDPVNGQARDHVAHELVAAPAEKAAAITKALANGG